MTRPKTYGEYADLMHDVRVDARLHDREISDDAWRILNLHNEIPQNVKTHFGIKDETVACVDYYDENNVAIVATTKDCYEPIMMSAIVGDRFEALVDCLLETDRWDTEYNFNDTVDSMFEKLRVDLVGGIKRDIYLRGIDFELLKSAVDGDPHLLDNLDETFTNQPWLRRNKERGIQDEPAFMYRERLHRQIQSRLDTLEGHDIYRYEPWEGDDNFSLGLRLDVSWPNPEREDELLRRRFEIKPHNGLMVVLHEDDVIYTNRDTDIPLQIQYHSNYGDVRDVKNGVPYTAETLQDTVEAVMAKVDWLMVHPPVRETILPKDLEFVHELRLSNVSPHAAEMLGIGNEHLYVYTHKGDDGQSTDASVDVSACRGDDPYAYVDTRLKLSHREDSDNWHIHVNSGYRSENPVYDEKIHVTDSSARETKLTEALNKFGEFIETEYSKSIVSDLEDANEQQL